MRRALAAAAVLGVLLAAGAPRAEKAQPMDDPVSRHMAAEAMLTAHFIDAALRAGMSRAAVNAVLSRIAARSVISEFWISDEKGRVEFTSVSGANFRFPTDPKAGTQAAPFAALLGGAGRVVVQGFQPRELDAALFKYVGVSGVDKPRIVQVGVSAGK